jgi:hypothetical protein
MSNIHPKSRHQIVVIDGVEYVFRGGTAVLSAGRNGGVGGSATSIAQVLSVPVIEDLARALGVPEAQAKDMLYTLGRIFQQRLLRGLPCGIPFVGGLYISQKRYTVEEAEKKQAGQRSRLAKLKAMKARGYRGWKTCDIDSLIVGAQTTIDTWLPFRNRVSLIQARHLRNFYSDNAPYLGRAKDHARSLYVEQHRRPGERPGVAHLRRRIRLAQEGAPPLQIPKEEQHEHLISAASRRRYAVA